MLSIHLSQTLPQASNQIVEHLIRDSPLGLWPDMANHLFLGNPFPLVLDQKLQQLVLVVG